MAQPGRRILQSHQVHGKGVRAVSWLPAPFSVTDCAFLLLCPVSVGVTWAAGSMVRQDTVNFLSQLEGATLP